jgi:hypothetical protein
MMAPRTKQGGVKQSSACFSSTCRMFHLNRCPKYYTWTSSRTKRLTQWKHWILGAIFRCCSWYTTLYRYGWIAAVSSINKHLLWQKLPMTWNVLLFGVLLPYLALPCQVRLDKCFTNSSKRFRWSKMNTHSAREYIIFSPARSSCATGVSSGLATCVTLTTVSWGKLTASIIWDGPTSNLISVRDCWVTF